MPPLTILSRMPDFRFGSKAAEIRCRVLRLLSGVKQQMGWMAPAPGIAMCQSVVSIKDHEQKEPSVMKTSTVGLDLAKNVFQVHAIDEAGEVIVGKALRRPPGAALL